MSCFLIKKNPGSTLNPWLGIIPTLGPAELFGKISVILGSGGRPCTFGRAEEAFGYIRKHHPNSVGVMQVYELIDEGDSISLTCVPWPT